MHRFLWCAAAAMLALASCGPSRAAPSPTIEYRTPTPIAPACECSPPTEGVTRVATAMPTSAATFAFSTETPIPTAQIGKTPTATPEQFKPAITVPTTIQVSGQSLEKPAPVGINATLAAAGWPSYLWPWANAIIWRESQGQAWAVNASSGAAGWFQIMPSTWAEMGCWGDPLNAYDNAACAWRLYQVAGVSPWAVG